MLRAAAAKTGDGFLALGALVRRVTALGTPCRLPTVGATVAEALALVAAEGVRDEDANVFA